MQERARRIINAAVELAESGGFEAVRLRDVASESGVALGTVYRYFKSKEDLLAAALAEEIEALEKRANRNPPVGDTPLERVMSLFRAATRALLSKPGLAQAVLRALVRGESELTAKTTLFNDTVIGLITTALRGDGEAGPQDADAAFVLQRVWFASLVGWASNLHDERAVLDHVQNTAELLLEDS